MACEDRVSRLERALKPTSSGVFLTEAERLSQLVREKEAELMLQVQTAPTVLPAQLQRDLAALRERRTVVLRYHADHIDMLYRTLRDVYNADAAEPARVA
jgi:hypothetical protein